MHLVGTLQPFTTGTENLQPAAAEINGTVVGEWGGSNLLCYAFFCRMLSIPSCPEHLLCVEASSITLCCQICGSPSPLEKIARGQWQGSPEQSRPGGHCRGNQQPAEAEGTGKSWVTRGSPPFLKVANLWFTRLPKAI